MAVEAQLRRHEALAARRPDKIVGAVWASTAGCFVGIGERVNPGHSGHGQIVSIATDLRNISVDETPSCSNLLLGRHIEESAALSAQYSPETRLRRELGPRIDRHRMGRCCSLVSQAVDDYTDDDIRHCGCPIGSKRRQERRSRGLFHGFCPSRFPRREADYLLPRFLDHDGVVRLLLLFFVTKRVTRGCPGAELRPATSHTLSY